MTVLAWICALAWCLFIGRLLVRAGDPFGGPDYSWRGWLACAFYIGAPLLFVPRL